MLKAVPEGDEGEGVMLPMVVHRPELQEAQVLDPVEFEYWPIAQGVQFATEGAPIKEEDVPAWQGTQVIAESEKVPGRHCTQVSFWVEP